MSPLLQLCHACGTEVPTRRPSLAAVEDVLVQAVAEHPGLGVRELRRFLQGMGQRIGATTAQHCLDSAVRSGRVVRFTTPHRAVRHYVVAEVIA